MLVNLQILGMILPIDFDMRTRLHEKIVLKARMAF